MKIFPELARERAPFRCLVKGLLLALSFMAFQSAIAGPPYATDDPEPVDFRHFEAYFASQYLHFSGGIQGTGPHIEFNYGAAPNLQLHIIAPFTYNDPNDGSPATYGFGDTEFGVKYRFLQETNSVPMAGIFPLVELSSGSAQRGLGNGKSQFFLPLWLQKGVGNWTFDTGGGYWVNPGIGNENYWFFGFEVQNQVTKQLSIGTEIYHHTPTLQNGLAGTGFDVGAVYDLDSGHHLLFSIGHTLAGPRQITAYAAFQWTFGPHEKPADQSPKTGNRLPSMILKRLSS